MNSQLLFQIVYHLLFRMLLKYVFNSCLVTDYLSQHCSCSSITGPWISCVGSCLCCAVHTDKVLVITFYAWHVSTDRNKTEINIAEFFSQIPVCGGNKCLSSFANWVTAEAILFIFWQFTTCNGQVGMWRPILWTSK